jgi:hypothetical protein
MQFDAPRLFVSTAKEAVKAHHMNNQQKLYQSAGEIEEIVNGFETCALRAGDFRHREHLTVIVWYLSKFSTLEATSRMREALYKFLDHHGVDRRKYHETITLFWVRKVRALTEAKEREHPLALVVNEVIESCNDAKLIFGYYSRELIDSALAREQWVEPDLRPIDF